MMSFCAGLPVKLIRQEHHKIKVNRIFRWKKMVEAIKLPPFTAGSKVNMM
jgi:hypothetical protein